MKLIIEMDITNRGYGNCVSVDLKHCATWEEMNESYSQLILATTKIMFDSLKKELTKISVNTPESDSIFVVNPFIIDEVKE